MTTKRDACDPAPIIEASLHVTRRAAQGPAAVADALVRCGEIIQLVVGSGQDDEEGSVAKSEPFARAFTGDAFALWLTAVDRCDNMSVTTFDPTRDAPVSGHCSLLAVARYR